jgi:fructosamine-3-kinase
LTRKTGAGFDTIVAAIGECTGTPFQALSVKPVSGGSIHRAWHLDDGVLHYFVKTGPVAAAPMFAAEAEGLLALSATAAVATPTFVTQGEAGGEAFLVLEHLELKAWIWPGALDSARHWRNCIATARTRSAGRQTISSGRRRKPTRRIPPGRISSATAGCGRSWNLP